ncbi:MAG: DNA-binding protein [Bacteroidales bacterium]|nr:DNA-binding protein [Bacteroidales bacterium]
MKIKNILVSFVAFLALAAGCNQVEPDHFLDEVRLSSSYVAINMDGGSTAITVDATSNWTISGAPDWLTISPASGSTGSSNVTFSASKTLDGRTAEVVLTCAGKTQNINVIQGLATVSKATCAEVIAGPESKTYLVTGTCTRIANTSYGNWYLNDGTGEIYIYGTVNASGSYAWSSFNIEVGDEVTVQGPKTVYNGTVELVDATFISVNKSLIKVEEIDPEDAVLPIEGGDFKVKLSNKGTGLYIDIPDDAKSWLSIASISGNTVTFHAAANQGGDRATTLVLKTKSGSKEYSCEQALTQKGAIIECSVADFNAAAVGNTQYRITGVITRVANASYGNYYIKDWSGETYVYGTGSKGDFEKGGWKVGDIVTVVGKRDEYKGTIEMTGSTIEKTISVSEISIADFLAKEDSKDVYYMVTGTIDEVANATYGNLYINDGAGNRLYVYGCYPGYGASGDNRKGFLETAGIAVGDQLTMIGYKDTYKGTIELCGGIYFSHQSAD